MLNARAQNVIPPPVKTNLRIVFFGKVDQKRNINWNFKKTNKLYQMIEIKHETLPFEKKVDNNEKYLDYSN